LGSINTDHSSSYQALKTFSILPMKPTIKLLCVIEGTTVNGPAKNLLNFCRLAQSFYFQDAGLPRVEVSIVTFHRLGKCAEENGQRRQPFDSPPNSFVAAAREEGVDVDVINERFRFDPRVVPALRRIVAQQSTDIIQTHGVKSHFLVKLSGIWRRHPWIGFHHGYTSTDLKMLLYNQFDRWSLRSADRVVTVCHAFADQLARQGVRRERISVQHNSIETNGSCGSDVDLSNLKERLGIVKGQHIILAVGRLSREKGHMDLIDALGALSLANSQLDPKLVIVGDGPERLRIERAARSQGLAERLIFAGQVGDVRPFYALADALVLPSHSEGSPNVLLEAMAARVPIVATSVGGVPEILENDKTALLVSPGNPRMLAGAMDKLLSDVKLGEHLAANAFARVRRRYSPETYARSLINIYRDVTTIRNPKHTAA
jgi:glycosyltransferase involved in cell wall biosynthesis